MRQWRGFHKVNGLIVTMALGLAMVGCGSDGTENMSAPASSQGTETEAMQSENTQAESIDENGTDVTESQETNLAEMSAEATSEEAESETIEKFYVQTEDMVSLIDDLTEKYGNMDRTQFISAIIISNLDHFTTETLEELLSTYGLTKEDCNDQFKAFVESYHTEIKRTSHYYRDMEDADKDAYNNLPEFYEFAITDTDKKTAMVYDNVFAQNATVKLGNVYNKNSDYLYEVDLLKDNFSKASEIDSFRKACFRLEYRICKGKQATYFDDVTHVFLDVE